MIASRVTGWVVAIVAVAATLAGCGGSDYRAELQRRMSKHTEITNLWTQIRAWRREAKMELDPPPGLLSQVGSKPVREAARVCPDGHPVPKSCDDICSIGDAICDNAEAICGIADELGKDDDFAQQKCASAKASCREAKQRCCDCSEADPPAGGTP
ncbi:MAG: hypothetical protein AB7O24_31285 [Kofleriaceae bacterium]